MGTIREEGKTVEQQIKRQITERMWRRIYLDLLKEAAGERREAGAAAAQGCERPGLYSGDGRGWLRKP
jgi:hypothetical protein